MKVETELYFLIDLSSQLRKDFFETEFPGVPYDDEGEVATINGTQYSVDRIVVNGEQFLIKGCEIVKCIQI